MSKIKVSYKLVVYSQKVSRGRNLQHATNIFEWRECWVCVEKDQ